MNTLHGVFDSEAEAIAAWNRRASPVEMTPEEKEAYRVWINHSAGWDATILARYIQRTLAAPTVAAPSAPVSEPRMPPKGEPWTLDQIRNLYAVGMTHIEAVNAVGELLDILATPAAPEPTPPQVEPPKEGWTPELDAVVVEDARKARERKLCMCGEPLAPKVTHRTDGPCYYFDPTGEPTPPASVEARAIVLRFSRSLDGEVTKAKALHADITRALAARDAEIASLREIVSKSVDALKTGAFARPEFSLEFGKHIPSEIGMVVGKLRAQAEKAEAALVDRDATIERLRDALEEIESNATIYCEDAVIARRTLATLKGESK